MLIKDDMRVSLDSLMAVMRTEGAELHLPDVVDVCSDSQEVHVTRASNGAAMTVTCDLAKGEAPPRVVLAGCLRSLLTDLLTTTIPRSALSTVAVTIVLRIDPVDEPAARRACEPWGFTVATADTRLITLHPVSVGHLVAHCEAGGVGRAEDLPVNLGDMMGRGAPTDSVQSARTSTTL
jgi:hypothetical protein